LTFINCPECGKPIDEIEFCEMDELCIGCFEKKQNDIQENKISARENV